MSASNAIQNQHPILALAPAADAFAGTVRTKVIKLANAETIIFTILRGTSTGGTGVSTVTLNSCPDDTPSSRTAIPFRYRVCTSDDTQGNWTECAATGFDMTAGSNQTYQVSIEASELEDGEEWVELTMVEDENDDPCTGAVLAQLFDLKYAGDAPPTALA